ncbi:hypothetical protein GCM10010166_12410 [Couchioplanes caeruleus subsp. azureus]|nr:hypothetical protein GCM10010166_12410 [Couchioplanes caeruleus subsp. azureus]
MFPAAARAPAKYRTRTGRAPGRLSVAEAASALGRGAGRGEVTPALGEVAGGGEGDADVAAMARGVAGCGESAAEVAAAVWEVVVCGKTGVP